MKFNIDLTWSKIIALLVLGLAGYLDIINGGTTAFMYAMPFIITLILGKQWQDGKLKMKGSEVYGCMDRNASNFNRNATIDDGSCQYIADPGSGG